MLGAKSLFRDRQLPLVKGLSVRVLAFGTFARLLTFGERVLRSFDPVAPSFWASALEIVSLDRPSFVLRFRSEGMQPSDARCRYLDKDPGS